MLEDKQSEEKKVIKHTYERKELNEQKAPTKKKKKKVMGSKSK